MKPTEGNLRQCQPAARLSGGGPGTWRSGAGIRARTVISSVVQQVWGSGMIRPTLSGLLIATAIMGATYLAAQTVADGAAFHSRARSSYATIQQQASANYRRARIHCQRLPAEVRDTCIARAHAEEARARSTAAAPLQSHAAAFRLQTDAAIDAGDRDAIVIEPACNVVARGQVGVCEIQVGGSTNVLAQAEMNRGSAARAKPVARDRQPLGQPRGGAQTAAKQSVLQARAVTQARGTEMHLMVAAVSR